MRLVNKNTYFKLYIEVLSCFREGWYAHENMQYAEQWQCRVQSRPSDIQVIQEVRGDVSSEHF